MRKKIYDSETIRQQYVFVNGVEMRVIDVHFYGKDKPSRRNRTIVDLCVFDYDLGRNYNIQMNLPEWHHLCRCHWVNYEKCNY